MVAALPDDISERELKKLFEKFGEIGDVFVPRFRDSNRGRGFAFVRFAEKRDRDDCIDELERHPLEMAGKTLRAEPAKDRPRPGGDGWLAEGKRPPTDPREDRRRRSRSRDRGGHSRRRSRSRSRDRYSSRRRSRSRSRDRRR